MNDHLTLPLPEQVELLPGSRFSERHQGNISYLKYLHHSGEFMLEAFMGEPLPSDRELNAWELRWNVWVQWTCLIGLLTHYELRDEPKSLECATRIGDWIMQTYNPIDNDDVKFIAQGHGFTNVAVINQMRKCRRCARRT